MDKNAIKKYAVWARRELISRVSQRAALYDITAEGYGDPDATAVRGKILSEEERKQRSALIDQVKNKGYEQVMEEIAYTWFNRFAALRFMEVNGYLPTHIRVFTDDENNFKPQILTEAINMELDGLDMQKVYDLKNTNDDETLYKYLLITQCNALSSILPGMFQKIADYTELLFPDNLLREGSVVEQMIAMIPQEDWTDQVQIIGWLYQYYNTEPKDQVFANLKKNIKISKENIPAATQLFTPDWIVRYMVENSLGRLWLEGHPNDDLKARWKYYLDEVEQEPEVQVQLDEIRKDYAALKPEDIRAIDPCQGSGHILTYMFDVLVQIYEAYGYSAREAVSSIVEHNIWGLDIDERASQLAYFSVMMKARQYDRRFFNRGIQPHVYAIQESNNLDPHCIEYFADGRNELKSAMDTLVKELHDAKEYGSILNVTQVDFEAVYTRFDEIRNETAPSIYSYQTVDRLLPFVQVAQAMAQKYHATVTNPPYMGAGGMSTKLTDYVKRNYRDSKNDLFAVFIERCRKMTRKNGHQSMITQHAWMFLTSFEKLRGKLQTNDTLNMIHLGARAFEEIGGEVVQTTSFVFRNTHVKNYKGVYVRLVEPSSQQGKENMFLDRSNRFIAQQINFTKIPGSPIAYWVSENYIRVFSNKKMSDYGDSCIGMRTGDNARFLRLWYEIATPKFGIGFPNSDEARISGKKWFPYCKGGSFRKWYGNNEYLVNWEDDGYEIKENTRRVYPYLGDNLGWKISNENYYFQPGLTWSGVGARVFGVRSYPQGMIFDSGANSYFVKDKNQYYYFAGLLNCVIMNDVIKVINPTINTGCGVIAQLPAIVQEKSIETVTRVVKDCIDISKADWDAFETSWDFSTHPFIAVLHETSREGKKITIEQAYEKWQENANNRFQRLKTNEEKLNQLFLKIYGLDGELSDEVDVCNVSVCKADLQREVRSFISYAVGCMFGRYSLDVPGLIYAGGQWDVSKYTVFYPDKDGIIPICDDEYFEDDIVGRFIKFVEVVNGNDILEDNLRFIADALGGKGSSREVIRNYFINEFYADHLKIYQKRPIYWLFDSGKKNGFKCLIYMHRYQPDTIARIRTDYVHEQQSRYRTAIADLESRAANAGTSERMKLTKRLDNIKAQAEELRVYEEKIHHLADQMITIDLDDGVKVNYAKFQDVLAKIK